MYFFYLKPMHFQPKKVHSKISLETGTFPPQICLWEFFFLLFVFCCMDCFPAYYTPIENINNYSAFLKFPSV